MSTITTAYRENNGYRKIRLSLQCFATVLTLAGLGLTAAAMFTSSWQIAYADGASGFGADPFSRMYERGLARDCVRTTPTPNTMRTAGTSTSNTDWICFWKLSQYNFYMPSVNDQFYNRRQYQITVLILLGVSGALAILTIILAAATWCVRLCNIPWAVCIFLTGGTCLIGMIIFIQNARVNNSLMYQYNRGKRFTPYDFPNAGYYPLGSQGYYPQMGMGGMGMGGMGYPNMGNGYYSNMFNNMPVNYNYPGVMAANSLVNNGYMDNVYYSLFNLMDNYEGIMWYGESFYLCIAGFVCYGIVFILACICVGLSFCEVKVVPRIVTAPSTVRMYTPQPSRGISRSNSMTNACNIPMDEGIFMFDNRHLKL